jgi:hypothetical protein
MSRAAGPFKILAKINDNAYKPYLGEEDEMPSMMASIQEGG